VGQVDVSSNERRIMMSLGERCDEIVRLIDETLVSVVADADGGTDGNAHRTDAGRRAHPSGSALAGRARRPVAIVAGGRRRGGPHTMTEGLT
jgi:hypothetical protein